MSIYSAMLAGVTGLTANSSALAAISDNIANVNTVGYKRNANNFSTLVTSVSASSYSAGGVRSITHQYNSQQGLLQSSSSGTDLAISGAGFFVTTQKPEDLTPTDARLFTRAGSFTVDKLGYPRMPPVSTCKAGRPTPMASSPPIRRTSRACGRSTLAP
jgi:flagellar hook protein FlgE